MTNSKQFDIYWTDLDPTRGSEIHKTRPCVVVSPDEMNTILNTIIVIPLTRTIINWPFRIEISAAGQAASAACDQIRAISKERLGDKIGSLSIREQELITDVLQAMFNR